MKRPMPNQLAEAMSRELQSLGALMQAQAAASCTTDSGSTLPVADGPAAGRRGRKILRIGGELEMATLQHTGEPALVANECVRALGPWASMEFPRCVIELTTDAMPFGSEFFPLFGQQLLDRRMAAAEQAKICRARLVDIGLLGMVAPEALEQGETFVSDAVRYRSLLRYLGQRNGRYTIELRGLEGPVRVTVPSSPVPAGFTCGFSPNVEFDKEIIGLAADLTAATAFTAPILSSSSPFAFGRVGEWNSRISCWQYGMDPERKLSPFGPGKYWGVRDSAVLSDWYAFSCNGELVLSFEEAGMDPASRAYPALTLVSGTRWVQTGRFRPGLSGGELHPYFENRLMDTGLTVVDDAADTAFYAGLIAGLLLRCGAAEELISYTDAEAAFDEARTTGEATVVWAGQRQAAGKLILEQLLPLAYEGLMGEGIDGKTAAALLGVVQRRLTRRKTAAHWLLERYRAQRAHCAGPLEAIRRVFIETAGMQQRQSNTFSVMEGVADW